MNGAARAAASRIELEADHEHVEDDAELRDDTERRRGAAPERDSSPPPGATRPSSDGPSRMPDSTSPMTGGWPIAATSRPSSRPADDDDGQGEQDVKGEIGVHDAPSPAARSRDARPARARSRATPRLNQRKRAAGDQQVDADERRERSLRCPVGIQ